MFMGNVHAYSRFRAVERAIYLDDMLTNEERTDLNKKIAAALEHWRRPTMVQVVFTYALPVVGLLINVYKSFFPSKLPQWVGFVGLLLLSYALLCVVSAFMSKRSLMLGASGRAIYFPGGISGNQGYGKEREILDSVGINTREWPFDIALFFISLGIGFASSRSQSAFYQSLGVSVPALPYNVDVVLLVDGALFVMLIVLVLYRRRITGRS